MSNPVHWNRTLASRFSSHTLPPPKHASDAQGREPWNRSAYAPMTDRAQSRFIRTVPWPKVGKKGALIKVGACGVCGTDLHILKGHWPKPLPWPFTLGHEIGGVLVEVGSEFTEDFMSKPLKVGSKVMIPPLMPCGHCYYCIHYPQSANKCLTPVYYGRYLGFDKAPHLWGGWAEYVYVDLEMLPGTKIYKLPDDMPLRLGALAEPLTSCIRALNRATRAGGLPGATPSSSRAPVRSAFSRSPPRGKWGREGHLRRRAGRAASGAGAKVRRGGDRRY